MTTASWQPDPIGRHELRWWDGANWTDNVSDQGTAGRDPLFQANAAPGNSWAAPGAPGSPPAPGGPPPPVPTTQIPITAPATVLMPTTSPPLLTTSLTTATAAPTGKPQTGKIVALLTVVALGGGAVYLGTKDNKPSTSPGTVTTGGTTNSTAATNTTVVTSSTASGTTDAFTTTSTTIAATTTTVAPATTSVVMTADMVLAALPAGADFPADWQQTSAARTTIPSKSGPGFGFCGGGNAAARAQAAGSTFQVGAASFELPNGAEVGIDAFTFPTEAAAEAYLTATEQQANGCMNDPPTYTMPESEADWFAAGYGDDAVWNVVEPCGAFPETSTEADTVLRTAIDMMFTTKYKGINFAVTATWLDRVERHGRVILDFWVQGRHGRTGWSGPQPSWVHEPVNADVDSLATSYRAGILQKLTAAGIL